MRHVQVATQDDRFAGIQRQQILTEVVLPRHAIVQAFQSVLRVRRVTCNQKELFHFKRDDTALVVVFVDTNAVGDVEWMVAGENRCAGVSLFIGVVPVTLVTVILKVELTFLHLRLLQAEEIGIQLPEGLAESLAFASTQTIDIPTDEFHNDVVLMMLQKYIFFAKWPNFPANVCGGLKYFVTLREIIMNIAIVGTGYVGLVSGTCFAEMGAHVTCVDVDTQKIEKLKNGIMPIYEPGLEELVKRNVEYGRLQFTTDLTEVLDDVEVVFSAVGTPPDEDGSADLKYVLAVAKQFGQNINKYTILVTKSTVPVGTAKKVKAAIQAELDKRGVDVPFDVASNPEFLKEGAAIKDFMSPDRVVVGTESEKAKEVMTRLYKPFLINNFRVIFMDIPSAEMTKYAANAMLATRISFMNDIANLCERVGANVDAVRKGIGTDARIGTKFLYAGCGYGGSCFPKDVKALLHTGLDNGYHMEVIEAVERVNERQKSIVYDKIIKAVGSVKGKTVAIIGLSFKPETDDMREAPALVVIDKLLKDGATVRVFDPIAMDECKRRIGDSVFYAKNMYDAADGADVFALMTEWRQFRLPSWNVIQKVMNGNVVVDGRNIYDRQELEDMGFVYTRIGEK